MTLVERIKALCSSRNTTLIGLERELNLGRGTIRKWDESSPAAEKLQKVAEFFNVSTDFLLLGFERNLLSKLIGYVQNGRTLEQFAVDSNVDFYELSTIRTGILTSPPSLVDINKIADTNPVSFIVDKTELLRASGYIEEASLEELNEPSMIKEPIQTYNPSTPITDVKAAMNLILAQPGLMLNGELLSDESKIALANAIQMGLAYAEQMEKQKSDKK